MSSSDKRARNGEVEIAWQSEGEGAPVLLIHGLGYARWGWGPLPAALAARFQVLSFDNRGIGGSSVPPGPYSAREMAGDALAVLDAAGIDRANVVGTSLGGMIAQELALEWPDRVDRLALLSTTPGTTKGVPMPAATVELLANAAQLDPLEALRLFVVNALDDNPPAELVEALVAKRAAAPQDPAGWAAQAAAGMGYDGGDRLEEIDTPTLVMTGTSDRVVDPENSAILADNIVGASLVRMPGGHLMFWAHPDVAATHLIEFFQ